MQEFFIKDNPASVPGESEEDAFKMSIVVYDEDAEAVMSLIAMPGLAIDYGLDGCLYAYLKTHRGQVDYARPLHRELIDAPRGVEIVHQNGDCLDNRRSNLIHGDGITSHKVREARLRFKSGLRYHSKQWGWFGWWDDPETKERRQVTDDTHKSRRYAAIALMRKLLRHEPVRRDHDGRGYVLPYRRPMKDWKYTPEIHKRVSRGYVADSMDNGVTD